MRALKLLRRLSGNLAGSAAIEFGFLLPVFMMVAMGFVELGNYASTEQALTEAVHEGGRFAVVHGSLSSSPATIASLESQVQNNSNLLTPNQIAVTATFSRNNNPGSTVKLVATYPWSPTVPLLKLPSVTIKATSTSIIQN